VVVGAPVKLKREAFDLAVRKWAGGERSGRTKNDAYIAIYIYTGYDIAKSSRDISTTHHLPS
jgi:hypothetical protein